MSINQLSDEMNARFSQKMGSMMDLSQSQINWAISFAVNDKVIPEIQSVIGNLPLNRNGSEPCSSLNEDGIGNAWKNKKFYLRPRNVFHPQAIHRFLQLPPPRLTRSATCHCLRVAKSLVFVQILALFVQK